MSDDLVKRLRDAYPATQDMQHTMLGDLMDEAADRIAALGAERDEWKEAATGRHPNPADFRYWEGRYRDEKDRADRLEAEVARLRGALQTWDGLIEELPGESGLTGRQVDRLCRIFNEARAALTAEGDG